MVCSMAISRFASLRLALPLLRVINISTIQSRFNSDVRYTDEHAWVRRTGTVATVGITKTAADLYGDIMYLKLPSPGESFKKGDIIGNVESTKAASDISSPVSGKVEAINQSLVENLRILNRTPETEGWLVKMELTSPNEIDELMTEEEYQNYLKREQ
nr:glycine cleavage system H protein [Hymenolepis microstoma]